MENPISIKKFEGFLTKQLSHIRKSWSKNKVWCIVVVVLYSTFILIIPGYSVYSSFRVKILKDSITEKNEQIANKNSLIQEKDSEILRLEQKIIPFKVVALEKFSGISEDAALSSLAERIGQVELTVVSLLDYQEVSKWSFSGSVTTWSGTGISFVGGGLASGWLNNHVSSNQNGSLNINCNNEAIKKYVDTIRRFEYYPFPYYVLSECQKRNGQPEWGANRAKAYKIVSITTRIPGHHSDHDWLLRELTK